MNILIDIGHPAQLNFLKNAILSLTSEHKVYVTFLNRGRIKAILAKELSFASVTPIGKHNGKMISILLHANLLRMFSFVSFIVKNRIDIGINGGVPLGFALKLLRRKHIQFDDDVERKLTIILELMSSDELIIFPAVAEKKRLNKVNIDYVHSLKEWAYLSPAMFSPNLSALMKYDLSPKEYIFVREVSNKSFNYIGQKSGVVCQYQNVIKETGLKVLLSLEEKDKREFYPEDWIVLNEPVEDIHSLIYYSYCLISSGDSMAREAAMLGVMSVYCGIRDMAANKFIQQYGLFHWVLSKQALKDILDNPVQTDQEKSRSKLQESWVDVNDLIINTIKKYERR